MNRCTACGSTDTAFAFFAPDWGLRAVDGEFPYSRCRACRSVFANPQPEAAVLAAAYGEQYGNYRSERGFVERLAEPILRREARRVVEAAAMTNHPALEIGCGTGRFLERLRDTGWSGPISGVEYDAATARGTAARTGFPVAPGTAEDCSLDEGPYGAIVLRHVVEHLREPEAVLSRLAGRLAEGGVLYLATPDADALSARVFGRRWWGYEVPRHLCVYSSEALRAAVGRVGLEVVSERWAFAPEMWNASAYLALDRGRGRRWTARTTSLLNPVASGFGVLGGLAEVATHRSTMYGLIARQRPA